MDDDINTIRIDAATPYPEPSVDALLQRVPEWANDARLNLRAILAATDLTPQQLWGTALAAAAASRNTEVLQAIAYEAQNRLSAAAFRAALAASAAMSMSNVYYRFVHLVANRQYATMPPGLRMQALARPGVEVLDFELWNLAVSAINGCGACLDGHERQVMEKGARPEAVQAAVKLAAVVHALAVALETHRAIGGTPAVPAAA